MAIRPIHEVDVATFKRWLAEKQIRPASLENVHGTHHNRKLYAHPNTKQPYVALPDTEAAS